MRVRLYNLFLLNKFYSKNSVHFLHSLDKNELEKKCAQEIRQVKVPQLALPPTGTSPNWPSPQAKIPQLPVHRNFWCTGSLGTQILNGTKKCKKCQLGH